MDKNRKRRVFINIPFDNGYEPRYIALIAGLVSLGLTPQSALEVESSKDRLHRIYDLLRNCGSSIHDLSRVQLTTDKPPYCPRFNMPFEAGLAVSLSLSQKKHAFFIFESERFRLQKSLSDLNGIDPRIHDGTVAGILRVITEVFNRVDLQTGGSELFRRNIQVLYKVIRRYSKELKKQNNGLFSPASFRAIVYACQIGAEKLGMV